MISRILLPCHGGRGFGVLKEISIYTEIYNFVEENRKIEYPFGRKIVYNM